jgi:hypothetical protein
MNKPRRVITFVGIVVVAAIMAASFPLTPTKAETGDEQLTPTTPTKAETGDEQLTPTKAETGDEQHGQMGKKKDIKKREAGKASHYKKIKKHLPMVSQAIEKAIEAIEAGDNKTALAELQKAQKTLAAIKEAIAKCKKSEFVNDSCPIMGTPIEPDKVTKDLIRDYKGQKVAFCCKQCPSAWDKLTDAEKDAKLAGTKPKPKPVEGHSEHDMH